MKAELVPENGDPPIPVVRDLTIVGRREYCDVVIDHHSLSKRHCLLVKTDGLLVIRDLATTNGTKVKGQKVRWAALLPDDRISFGAYKVRVYLGPDDMPAPSEQGKGRGRASGAGSAAEARRARHLTVAAGRRSGGAWGPHGVPRAVADPGVDVQSPRSGECPGAEPRGRPVGARGRFPVRDPRRRRRYHRPGLNVRSRRVGPEQERERDGTGRVGRAGAVSSGAVRGAGADLAEGPAPVRRPPLPSGKRPAGRPGAGIRLTRVRWDPDGRVAARGGPAG